ncbi:hypothetical protein AUR64_18320 [Haloprofundus marisrubri]|uniref:Uncharacterized protein n=1 Tax=Haloprofundus marisrubri TaxID=1514971 RepID=A0A0W1R5D5_9EURY|nr:hypothetical protein [Haloprofundus marisrubri]KTG08622.1 hypothetical protein AUR64_18320 [Haloprofundus marisrubri]
MRRQLLACGLALLLVLAGCTGQSPTLGDDPTTTDATADPATTENALALDEVDYPAGFAADGVTNATLAFETHRAAVQADTSRETFVSSTDSENTSMSVESTTISNDSATHTTMDVQVDDGASETDVDSTFVTSGNQSIETWERGRTFAYRTSADGEQSFGVTQGETFETNLVKLTTTLVSDVRLDTYLDAGTYEATEAYREGDRTYVVYEATELSETGAAAAANASALNASVDSYDGRLVVDDRGVVHEMRVTVTRTVGETQSEARIRYEAQVGDDAPSTTAPTWLDEVPDVHATVDDDGQYVAIDHAGGDSLPAGTTVTAFGSGFYATSLTESFDPDETLYLWVGSEDGEPTMQATLDAPPEDVAKPIVAPDGNVSIRANGGSVSVELLPTPAGDSGADAASGDADGSDGDGDGGDGDDA